MVIKKYLVSNMNEALTRIRYELGKDAVIISQRKIRRPGIKGFFSEKQIEVTAAIENSSRENSDKKVNDSFKDSIQDIQRIMEKEMEAKKVLTVSKSEKEPLEDEVREIKELLNKVIKNTDKDVNEKDELLQLIERLDIDLEFYGELKERVSPEDLENSLRKVIESEIEVSDNELSGNVVLIGPTGVGKTTTIAKLAGRLALIQKKKVGLITVDTYRIGAVEQLKTYAEIMSIPFKVVITIKEMEEAVESMKECDTILIDTTGRSSKNTMQISELRAFVEKAMPNSINLVISSTTKNKDIKTIVEGYSELNFNQIIITKLDETTTYGALYNIQKRAQKPIKFITTGQNVPDDIKIPTNDEIVRFIFEEESLC